jgi:hypothetical protein
LKRIFDIDIATCSECGGDVRIIASIEDPIVIGKILTHLNDKLSSVTIDLLPECRAPPRAELPQTIIDKFKRMSKDLGFDTSKLIFAIS